MDDFSYITKTGHCYKKFTFVEPIIILYMSNQKFSAAQRQALWLAHGRKCAYSGQLLDIRNMHIDHILPEELEKDPAAFNEIKIKYGLPDTFNLLGFENLLPSAQAINSQKHSNIFSEAQIHYFIGIAGAKKQTIEKEVERFERQLESSKAAILIQGLLESGKISPEEAARIFENHSGNGKDVYKLLESLSFIDGEAVDTIHKSQITELRKRKGPIWFDGDMEGLTFYNEEGDTRIITTCEEYDEAIKAGFYGRDNWTMVMSLHFERQCGLLNALANASIPSVSYISEPKVGVADISLLPYALFPHFEESVSPEITFQDKVRDGGLVIKHVGSHSLLVEEPECMGQQLIEVARADFNGDGIEDILLFDYSYAIGGTMRLGGTIIITRLTPTGNFELIDITK